MEKHLIIFGVNGDLGKGVTKVLLRGNYDKIYLCDRKEIDWVKDNSKVEKIKILDLSVEENVEYIFRKISPVKDNLFFLFTSIGGFESAPLEQMNYDKWKFMFNLNTNIAFLIAKHFKKLVKQSRGGSICFTSAYTSLKEEKNKSAYGASKAALNYLAKTLSLEGKDINLTSNIIMPYVLDTPDNRAWIEDTSLMVTPEKVGESIERMFGKFPAVTGNTIILPEDIVDKGL